MHEVGMRPVDWKDHIAPAEITNPFDLFLVLGVYAATDLEIGSAVRVWLAEHRDEVNPELLDNFRILAEVHDYLGDGGSLAPSA